MKNPPEVNSCTCHTHARLSIGLRCGSFYFLFCWAEGFADGQNDNGGGEGAFYSLDILHFQHTHALALAHTRLAITRRQLVVTQPQPQQPHCAVPCVRLAVHPPPTIIIEQPLSEHNRTFVYGSVFKFLIRLCRTSGRAAHRGAGTPFK